MEIRWCATPSMCSARPTEPAKGGVMRAASLFIDPGFEADLKDVTRSDNVELGGAGARRRR